MSTMTVSSSSFAIMIISALRMTIHICKEHPAAHAHVSVIDEHYRRGFDFIFGYLDYRVEPWGAVARCSRTHDGLILRQ